MEILSYNVLNKIHRLLKDYIQAGSAGGSAGITDNMDTVPTFAAEKLYRVRFELVEITYEDLQVNNGFVSLPLNYVPEGSNLLFGRCYVATPFKESANAAAQAQATVGLVDCEKPGDSHSVRLWATLTSTPNGVAGSPYGNTVLCQKPNRLMITFAYPGVWETAAGTMNVRRTVHHGVGTPQAALAVGGYNNTVLNVVESYNGSAWASAPSLSVARYAHANLGSQTAALSVGGYNGSADLGSVELFNGTQWNTVASLNVSRRHHAVAGTASAALIFGGLKSAVVAAEYFDGSAWIRGATPNYNNYYHVGSGMMTDAVSVGGSALSPYLVPAERFNGTAWYIIDSPMVSRLRSAAVGPPNAMTVFGSGAVTNFYDGIAWLSGPSMLNKREMQGSAGLGGVSAFGFGGATTLGTQLSSTDYYNTGELFQSRTLADLTQGRVVFALAYAF